MHACALACCLSLSVALHTQSRVVSSRVLSSALLVGDYRGRCLPAVAASGGDAADARIHTGQLVLFKASPSRRIVVVGRLDPDGMGAEQKSSLTHGKIDDGDLGNLRLLVLAGSRVSKDDGLE